MSILTQTPQTESDSEKLQRISKTVNIMSSRTYNDLARVQKLGIDLIWNNKEFTPQQVIDSLGDDAAKIFAVHGKLTDYLMTISALDGVEYIPALPTNAFTVDDGKITVTDLPYVP
jgi:hypothetical protein